MFLVRRVPEVPLMSESHAGELEHLCQHPPEKDHRRLLD